MATAECVAEAAAGPRRSWSDRTFSRVEAGSIRGSIFSLCCSAIGMGVLVLPYNMAQVGAPLALALLAAAGCAGLLSLRICCAGMHATRSHSYVETLTILFSARLAAALTSMLVIACFGLCCGYFVFASQLLEQLMKLAGAPALLCDRGALVAFSACLVFPASLFRNLSDFRHLTLASLGGLIYLTLLVVLRTSSYLGKRHLTSGWWWQIHSLEAVPKCLSLCFAAYVVHMNVFACYDELSNPTAGRINKVLMRSVWVQTLLYVSIALCGFLSFGSATPDNILLAYDLSDPFATVGRIFVSFQLLLAVPLTVHPGRAYLWPLLCMLAPALGSESRTGSDALAANGHAGDVEESFARSDSSVSLQPPSLRIHVALTAVLVASCALVAAKVNSASDLLGVVGGFAAVTYAFLLPAEMAWKLRHQADELAIDWESSPAPFIVGRSGVCVIAFLRGCCVLGYVAAAQCAWNMLSASSGP